MKVFGCLLALLFVFQHAATVEVDAEAKSVVLPCSVTLEDRKDLSVVWRRKDLNPSVIHFKEQGRDDLDNQNQNYRGRTSVSDPLQENGLASLTLSEPRLNDTGNYTCIIRREGKDLHRTEVPLLVNVCQHAAAVEVNTLAKSVVLPCSVTLEDRKDLSVVWRRKDLNPSVIHFKEQGRDDLDTQNQNYRGRTSVSDSLQENGLASLTLSEPRLNDSGTYTCIIRREGKDLHRTEVPLLVNEPFPQISSLLLGLLLGAILTGLSEGSFVAYFWRKKTRAAVASVCRVMVREGAQVVKLPYQTAVELPGGAGVEWSLSDPEPKVVHRQVIGCDQPEKQPEVYYERTKMTNLETGDLSLTLSDPCCEDSGIYVCNVRRDGVILAQRVVEVLVQAPGWIENVRSMMMPQLTTLSTLVSQREDDALTGDGQPRR